MGSYTTTATYGSSGDLSEESISSVPKKTINIARPLIVSEDGDAWESDSDIASVVKQNFKNLLLTKKGERIHRRGYGCDLLNMLFEQKTDQLKQSIAGEIIKTSNIWMRFLKIEKIYVLYQGDSMPSELIIQEPTELQTLIIIKYFFDVTGRTINDILSLTIEAAT